MAIPIFQRSVSAAATSLTKTFGAVLALGALPAAALAQTVPATPLNSFTQVYPTYRQEVRQVAFVPQRTFTAREVPVGGLNQIIDFDGSVAHIMPTRGGAQPAVMPAGVSIQQSL